MGGGGKKPDSEQGDTEDDEEVMETASASTSKSPMKPLTKSPAKSPAKSPVKKTTKSPAKGRGSKRSRDKDDISETPVAKKGKKPVSKYSPKCYQTGSKHKEAFNHPWVRYTLWTTSGGLFQGGKGNT